jgi:hypothetical protein
MSNKKLRLDPTGIPAEEGGNNSLNNSSSAAPSGGGGGGIFGGSTAAGAFRGKYTRPLIGIGGGFSASSTSRYAPYSISRDRPPPGRRAVPLIRASRDDDRGGGGRASSSTPARSHSLSNYNPSTSFGSSTSLTAQKIMETLASMSTPVVNAGRVRLDSISKLYSCHHD